MKDKLVEGVGVYNKGQYKAAHGKIKTKEYQLWKDMLARCYNERRLSLYPTYLGCSVSENFKDFQFFAEWCGKQTGFNLDDWHLDKDILVKGNKVYSENTCVFIPREINNLLNSHEVRRGLYPIGVHYDKDRSLFSAQIRLDNRCKKLGRYATKDEAYSAYKVAKEKHVKIIADKYKGTIDENVYEALLKWELS